MFCVKNVEKKKSFRRIKKNYKLKKIIIIRTILAMLHCVIYVCVRCNISLRIYYNSDILNELHRSLSLFVFLPSLPNRSIRDERRITSGVALSFLSLLSFFFSFFFFFSSYQAAVSADNIHAHTHTGQMHDADETTPRWTVSCIQFRTCDGCFGSLSVRLLALIKSFPTSKTYYLCRYRHNTHSFSCSGRSDEEAPLVASPSSIP